MARPRGKKTSRARREARPEKFQYREPGEIQWTKPPPGLQPPTQEQPAPPAKP